MTQSSSLVKPVAFALALAVHLILIAGIFGNQKVKIEGGGTGATAKLGTSFADIAASTMQPVQPDLALTKTSESAVYGQRPMSPVKPNMTLTATPNDHFEQTTAVAPIQMHKAVNAAPVASAKPVLPNTLAAKGAQAAQKSDQLVPAETPKVVNSAKANVNAVQRPSPQMAEVFKHVKQKPAVTKSKPVNQQNELKPVSKPKSTPSVASAAALAGQNDGSERSKSPSAGVSNQTSEVGNAAVSNYPGQVLRRIQRIPRPRVRSKGRAQVSFSISTNGGLASLRISRSSGSKKLDQAALRIVKKAAPFPKPPKGAQRAYSVFIESQ